MPSRVFQFACLVFFSAGFLWGCGPKYPACESDEDCRENEFCVDRLCQQCRDDADCPEGEACRDGACEAIENFCQSDDDCPPRHRCQDARCVAVDCVSDEDCGPGEVCREGRCAPAALGAAGPLVGEGGCRPRSIYFSFDSSLLDDEARDTLKKNVPCLESFKDTVVIEGHCDPRGTTEYNLALGDRRARAVKRYLSRIGVDVGLRPLSKGEEEAAGRDESGWAEDRRAEFQ